MTAVQIIGAIIIGTTALTAGGLGTYLMAKTTRAYTQPPFPDYLRAAMTALNAAIAFGVATAGIYVLAAWQSVGWFVLVLIAVGYAIWCLRRETDLTAVPPPAEVEQRLPTGRPGWLGPDQSWPCGRCGSDVASHEGHPCPPTLTP